MIFFFGLPSLWTYVSVRMALAALFSLLFCILLGPRFIRRLYELKVGQPIRMEECPLLGELHKKKQDTPTMGGILILVAMALSLLLFMRLDHPFTWMLGATTLFLGGLGAIDDYLKLRHKSSRGLRSRYKLALQLAFGGALCFFLPASEVYLPFLRHPLLVLSGVPSIFLTLFVIAGSSNAVNLSDGLDGLAAGLLIFAALPLAGVALLSNGTHLAPFPHVAGAGEIAVFLGALAGGCLGFLWYNGFPAQVFMGDTGSLALGGVLGVSAVLLHRELLLALVGGVFVAEALSVILQVGSFRLRGKRIFLCAPLHHHFEYKGWPETKVVLRFWVVGLLLAMIGVISMKLQ